jgi:RNA polymerase sigma-54 factor
MKQHLEVKLTQKMVMTPQLQQAIHLLMLNRMDLAQEMQEIVLENPLLEIEEEGTGDLEEWTSETMNGADDHNMGEDTRPVLETPENEDRVRDPLTNWEYSVDENLDEEAFHREERTLWESDSGDFSFEKVLSAPTTLADHLNWQLSFTDLSPAERKLAQYLIGNIDEDGYLHLAESEIPAELLSNGVSLERVVKTVHGFDPPGVGARTLQECLLNQARLLGQEQTLVGKILTDHFEDFLEMKTKGMAKSLKAPIEEVLEAIGAIRSLEPKPGRPYYRESPTIVVPDLRFYEDDEGVFRVSMNEQGLPRLRIQPSYRAMLKSAPRKDDLRDYLEEKFRAAQWFMKSVDQRRKTILRVGESILKHQEGFFRNGPQGLRPLVLRTIAEELGLHESTISRVTNQKYAESPFGVVELKYFFSGGVPSSGGGEHSAVSVREKIRQMVRIESTDHPMTDQEIMEKLEKQGVVIARRTVAKYRAELNIPSVSQRRRNHWDQGSRESTS